MVEQSPEQSHSGPVSRTIPQWNSLQTIPTRPQWNSLQNNPKIEQSPEQSHSGTVSLMKLLLNTQRILYSPYCSTCSRQTCLCKNISDSFFLPPPPPTQAIQCSKSRQFTAVKKVYTVTCQGFLQLDDIRGQHDTHLRIIKGRRETLEGHINHMLYNKG